MAKMVKIIPNKPPKDNTQDNNMSASLCVVAHAFRISGFSCGPHGSLSQESPRRQTFLTQRGQQVRGSSHFLFSSTD
eukprot:scaffold11057_cov175-Ochromonas_danica.AAC.1